MADLSVYLPSLGSLMNVLSKKLSASIHDTSHTYTESRFARDARWSETGDRYVIKLFRDYVFHQIDANKNPITSLAHVMTCLNKLDAGSDERILLIARDDQSCIVATYKEIKVVVEAAFRWVASSLHDSCLMTDQND